VREHGTTAEAEWKARCLIIIKKEARVMSHKKLAEKARTSFAGAVRSFCVANNATVWHGRMKERFM